MPVFKLDNELSFPHPNYADDEGLLAIGGDLSCERLILAYSNGIFPWPIPEYPLLWWSPNPRSILYFEKLKVSKSLRHLVQKQKFEVRFDTCFNDVISHCSKSQRKDNGTWINDEIIAAYQNLHQAGWAHSVETFCNGKLVGGLYGISIGGAFMGESMFHTQTDASKVALWYLVQKLKQWNFDFIDGQLPNSHLISLGFEETTREKYLAELEETLKKPTRLGAWV